MQLKYFIKFSNYLEWDSRSFASSVTRQTIVNSLDRDSIDETIDFVVSNCHQYTRQDIAQNLSEPPIENIGINLYLQCVVSILQLNLSNYFRHCAKFENRCDSIKDFHCTKRTKSFHATYPLEQAFEKGSYWKLPNISKSASEDEQSFSSKKKDVSWAKLD